MAMAFLGRAALIPKPALAYSIYLSPLISRSFSISASSFPLSRLSRSSAMLGLRPLTALMELCRRPEAIGIRCFSTHPETSSSKDPSPNWSNRPPKETILLEGCDFEHWMVVMEPPEGNPTRDEIIDSYIKILAQVVGSEEEARMKIYSVSTRHYYAFGCLVSEELSRKIKPLPRVRWVLPDSYLDVRNKDYGGEPFINGQAVPYDPKYHEEWVRNNARADDRRNGKPRNFDRSRNFERQRVSRDAAPMPNRDVQHSTPPRDIPVVGGGPNRVMGPSGGYRNMPPTGPAPPSGGPNGEYSNMPNSGGPSGGNSNMPPGGGPSGPSGDYLNMPPSGGPSRGYFNMPPSGGQSGGYSNMPPSGGPSGGYSNMPPSGGSSGGFSNMPRSGGPSGGYSNMPNTGGLGGGYSNVPNSGGPSEGYSNMPNSGSPSREMGGMQNRGYQNSYVRDRDVRDVAGGNTYQGSDMPGRDF